jgi:hypothetical protein
MMRLSNPGTFKKRIILFSNKYTSTTECRLCAKLANYITHAIPIHHQHVLRIYELSYVNWNKSGVQELTRSEVTEMIQMACIAHSLALTMVEHFPPNAFERDKCYIRLNSAQIVLVQQNIDRGRLGKIDFNMVWIQLTG